MNAQQLEAIKENAELVRSFASNQDGVEYKCNEDAVRWLDGFINDQFRTADQAAKNNLVQNLGCFLGECILNTWDGEWRYSSDYGLGIYFTEKDAVFPFSKVDKQLKNGPDDSVYAMFTSLPALLKLKRKVK
jgi:hypothetical protein